MGISREGALLSVMVLMSLVDDRIAEAEILRIRWIFETLAGRRLGHEDVRTVARQARADDTSLEDVLAQIGRELELVDRRLVLEAAFHVATADGKVVSEEDAMMRRLAEALRIEPHQFNAIARPFRVPHGLEPA